MTSEVEQEVFVGEMAEAMLVQGNKLERHLVCGEQEGLKRMLEKQVAL